LASREPIGVEIFDAGWPIATSESMGSKGLRAAMCRGSFVILPILDRSSNARLVAAETHVAYANKIGRLEIT
jgi:hypothetical protein